VEDFRSPEQILANVANEAKIAFNAEMDFFEWRAEHEDHAFPAFMKRYLQWLRAAEPYARSYERIASAFPQHMWRFKEIVLPIQREIFGTENAE
jgi:hypothetical protein